MNQGQIIGLNVHKLEVTCTTYACCESKLVILRNTEENKFVNEETKEVMDSGIG